MAKSSISPTLSWANANTVFFCVAVGTTLLLSPVRCASVKSPDSATLTFMSFSSCRAPRLVTRTTWVSDLPYELSPRTIFTSLCPSVSRVAVGAQQHGYMEVAALEGEHDLDDGIEGAEPGALEVGAGVQIQAVLAGLEFLVAELANATVGIGLRLADLLPVAVRLAPVQARAQAGRRLTAHGVEHVRRDA